METAQATTGDTEMDRISSTKETTPFHIWKHEVITLAGIAVADADSARLNVAYNMGESVWGHAQVQKLFAAARNNRTLFQRNMTACVRRVKVKA